MFMNLLMKPGLSAEQAKQAMATFYRDVPNVFADQYRTLFDQLLASDGAVAFNCTAGKDRTGFASALVLLTLGAIIGRCRPRRATPRSPCSASSRPRCARR